MKSKEQKRAEAIQRAKSSYVVKRWEQRGWTLEEYLDIFRPNSERFSFRASDREFRMALGERDEVGSSK